MLIGQDRDLLLALVVAELTWLKYVFAPLPAFGSVMPLSWLCAGHRLDLGTACLRLVTHLSPCEACPRKCNHCCPVSEGWCNFTAAQLAEVCNA